MKERQIEFLLLLLLLLLLVVVMVVVMVVMMDDCGWKAMRGDVERCSALVSPLPLVCLAGQCTALTRTVRHSLGTLYDAARCCTVLHCAAASLMRSSHVSAACPHTAGRISWAACTHAHPRISTLGFLPGRAAVQPLCCRLPSSARFVPLSARLHSCGLTDSALS